MPNIRDLGEQDFQIWHEDIKEILVKPTSPLASSAHSVSRKSTVGENSGIFGDGYSSRMPSAPLRHPATPNIYPRKTSVTSPGFDRELSLGISDTTRKPFLKLRGDMNQGLGDLNQWGETNLPPTPSNSRTLFPQNELSPEQDTFHDWSWGGGSTSEGITQSVPIVTSAFPGTLGSFSPNGSSSGSMSSVQRPPSASTTSTFSSGRRESLELSRYPSSSNIKLNSIPTPIQKKPLPPIIRKPVPSKDPTGLNTSGLDQRPGPSSISEVDERESVETIGERLILDET